MSSAQAAAPEQHHPYPATLELALLAFHRNVGPIRKQSEAKYGAFADLRTVLDAVTPPLLEQGLVLTQSLADAPDGSQVLRTELTHAPSGGKIASCCPIPSLQSLLDRVHELRGEVLHRFPLDLQLAAVGALPPVLPARSTEAGAELPPPPARQPGLRIEDQLKGLYTLLGQLGTTTNPLHALGGTITYLRRYQILSLLCLAAEDTDGESDRPAMAQAPQAAPTRTRRSRTTPAPRAQSQAQAQPVARPQPTPAPAPAPAAAAVQADPAAAPTKPATAPQQRQQEQQGQALPQAPAPEAAQPPAPAAPAASAASAEPGGDHPLTPSEVQALIAQIRTLPTETIPHLVAAFRQQFSLPSSALVSDYIRTWEHAAFIRQQVEQLMPAAA